MAKEKQHCLTAFQKLRRMQESDEYGNTRCISCGKPGHYKGMDAGHYISRRHKALSMEPDNVWPQCKRCNMYLGGNYALYRINLIKKIGVDRVTRLELMLSALIGNNDSFNLLCEEDQIKVRAKISNSDYKKLAKIYRKEIREIDFYG